MTRLVNSGFLFKAPPKNESLISKLTVQWRWRWFKLWSNKEFHYYEDFSCTKKKGSIPLDKVDITDLKYPIALPKHPWVISINVQEYNREYILAAADEKSLLTWGKALEAVLKVDYIKVEEIASTNDIRKRNTEDSTKYLKILDDRDVVESYQFSDIDSISPVKSLDTPTDRVSKVGPYEVYDPRLEGKQSIDSDDGIYMPMNLHALNAEGASPNTPDCESPDINEDPDEIKIENSKIIASNDVYEAMTSKMRQDIAEAEGPDGNTESNEVIQEEKDRYDHLALLNEHLEKAEELRRKRAEMRSQSTSEYDDICNYKAMNEEESIDLYRQGRANTIAVEEPEEQPIRPRKGSGLAVLEELRRGEVGKFQLLLESYWVMHIYLPNKTVIKELVNLELPVEVLIEKLARLFGQHNNLHIFSLYVLSDIHQTYETVKKTDKDLGKGDLRLNNSMSFIEQGITTPKFLQVVSTKDIDKMLYEDYLNQKAEMKLTEKFVDMWIPFVKGYFSIPDLREVANLSGYIHFVYQTIYDLKTINHEVFLPRNAREIEECIKKTREQSLQLKGTNIKDACNTFLNRILIWPTANTIAFPIKRAEKTNFRMKHTEILVVFAKEHIGIVKAEKNIDYGNFMYWWHQNDITDFEVLVPKDVLVIKLSKPFDEGSCEFHIKSPMNKILNQLLENFKNSKKRVGKYKSMGHITLKPQGPHFDD